MVSWREKRSLDHPSSTTGMGAPRKLNVASCTSRRALRSHGGVAAAEAGGPANERASHPSPKCELGKNCSCLMVTRGRSTLMPFSPYARSDTRTPDCSGGSVRQHTKPEASRPS